MASMVRVSLVAVLWFIATVCSELRVCAYQDEIPPMPAMAAGSASVSSASVVTLGCFLLYYAFCVFML